MNQRPLGTSAGLHLSLEFLTLPPQTTATLILVPLASKFAGSFLSAYITRLDVPFATAAGLMAKGVTEIAILLLLFHTGAINKGVFSLLVLLMFGYILLTPMGISYALKRLRRSERPYLRMVECRHRWFASPWKAAVCGTYWIPLGATLSSL